MCVIHVHVYERHIGTDHYREVVLFGVVDFIMYRIIGLIVHTTIRTHSLASMVS